MSHPTATDHFQLVPDDLQFAGPADRFAKNLAALELVHALEVAHRPATDEERRTLAHYSAFGDSALLNRLFRFDHAAGRYVLHDNYATFLSSSDARHLRAGRPRPAHLSR